MTACPRAFGGTIASENALKAAFIFHFISFTEWSDDQSDYNVCIPEDADLRETAQEAFKDKLINNRKIVVSSRFTGCHVLVSTYVPSTDTTLTIGQLDKGALFEFRLVDNKMKFAVDLSRIKNSKLKISSQLLKLAILDEGRS
jgi:hypothetical protein